MRLQPKLVLLWKAIFVGGIVWAQLFPNLNNQVAEIRVIELVQSGDRLKVTVENVSARTIRGLSLVLDKRRVDQDWSKLASGGLAPKATASVTISTAGLRMGGTRHHPAPGTLDVLGAVFADGIPATTAPSSTEPAPPPVVRMPDVVPAAKPTSVSIDRTGLSSAAVSEPIASAAPIVNKTVAPAVTTPASVEAPKQVAKKPEVDRKPDMPSVVPPPAPTTPTTAPTTEVRTAEATTPPPPEEPRAQPGTQVSPQVERKPDLIPPAKRVLTDRGQITVPAATAQIPPEPVQQKPDAPRLEQSPVRPIAGPSLAPPADPIVRQPAELSSPARVTNPVAAETPRLADAAMGRKVIAVPKLPDREPEASEAPKPAAKTPEPTGKPGTHDQGSKAELAKLISLVAIYEPDVASAFPRQALHKMVAAVVKEQNDLAANAAITPFDQGQRSALQTFAYGIQLIKNRRDLDDDTLREQVARFLRNQRLALSKR